jgi:hypothetical protein
MPNQDKSFLKSEEKEFKTYYKREMWWVEHRNLLKKIGIGAFVVFDACLILFAAWIFLDSYAISYGTERLSVAGMAILGQSELRNFSKSESAKSLVLSEAVAVSSGDATFYDLFASVTNQNSDWYATFKYYFDSKDGATEIFEGFILPGEERPLAVMKGFSARPSNLILMLDTVEWHRVDNHEIPDYQDWFADHALQISEATFSHGDDITPPEVSFTVSNKTAYNFYRPSFLVVLWRGGTVGGLVRVSTSEIKSGQTKEFSARWQGVVPAVSKVEVWPEINLLNPEAYSSISN